jgi:hippurate hydrolase
MKITSDLPRPAAFASCPASRLLHALLAALTCFVCLAGKAQSSPATQALVQARVQPECASLLELYKGLHATPELSLHEEKTVARLAGELRKAGFEVTTGVGHHGVVAVLRNGTGPTVLVRADMDALPVKEETGLPYASTVVTKDAQGNDVPVMHACGHDVHMTCLVGTARVLAQLKDEWRGTLVLIGQPAEEVGGGARAMLADGLFQRFPRPDFCLALHDSSELPAGTLGYTSGYANANVNSVDILVRGVGGHGAYPHKAKDPVVLAAQIILGLQTIASREVQPGEPVVVTVGSIHGGAKNNIIPDEVRLQLTVRSYTDPVRSQTLQAIERIARGQALAAGIPEDRMPVVNCSSNSTPALFNNPELAERVARVFKAWFGETNVVRRPPSMGGEDFAEYGRTEAKVPIFMFALGAVKPEAFRDSEQTGKALPSLHSSLWAPMAEPTIKTGVTAMSAAVLELMAKKARAESSAVEGLWKVGVARSNITPTNALWLAGYASRTHAADGKATDLWLKVLALEDAAGHRAVIVTSDLLAIRGSLYRSCLPRFKAQFGLEPSQILLTASHTHCGPALPDGPDSLWALDQKERALAEQYGAELADKIIDITGRALADLAPARLAAGQAEAEFAANRRNNAASERERLAPQGALIGPVDHSVPVLAAYQPDGRLRAVLFGYACHNTTTRALYEWCGDYAGFAQAALEKNHPDATAMFFIGCGGDQDPAVRGGLDLARRYGQMLATAVESVLLAPPATLAPMLKTRMETVELNLGPVPSEAELEKLASNTAPYLRHWATNLLAELKSGQPIERTRPYPLQVWRFGERQLLITLGGEPVVDYALKFKREFGPQTWVAGYGNDVMAYIPSLRVLNEDKPPRASPLWGYEGSQAMQVLGLPAFRWANDVEDLITTGTRRLVQQVGEL